jgi:exodeoxyribonuclease V beta subunit
LVRNFGQAQRVRDALAERGIASVYSSDRSSVFEQQEAKVLLRILKAALLPERESLVKAAIGSDLFGWNVSQLNQLNENELAWERLVLQFKAFQHTWTRQGVLAALHELMNQQGIAVHLRKQVNGERRLTDFLHLCELLQNQSKSVESQYALVAWLEERIQQPNQNAQEQQLRLESEANQVKVVTYHKSKGLEYKIVFAPYVSYFWPNHRHGISISHDEQGNALVDVANKRLTEANQERIAEDIRLLYVTLTRSVYACYLGLPGLMAGTKTRPDPVVCPKYVSETGLGWLIGQGKKVLPDQLETVIQNWLTAVTDDMNTPAIKRTLPNTTYTEYQPADVHEDTLKLKTFNSSLDHNWWVTSYSRLVSGHHWVEEATDLIKDDIQIDQASNYDASVETKGEDALWLSGQTDQEQPVVELLDIDGSESVIKLEHTIHHFPKGAEAGTFLHTLFESIEYEDCESLETKEIVRELLMASPLSHQLIERELPGYRLIGKSELETEHLKAEVISRWVEVLHSMMVSVLSTPLHGGSQQGSEQTPVLAETQQAQRLVEMEFLIPMARIDCHKVNQIIRQDPLSSQATSGLGFAEVQGMLKGFIDLTFEYNGRFYVLDWKSNYLGPDSCDYTQSAMQQAMLEHRYDFQYQLYTLALHRYLKTRLPDYDYDRHIGGAYYVFLRGVDGSCSDNGIFYTKPPKSMIEALDQLFSGSSADQVIDNPQATDKSEASKTESSQGIEVTTTMDTSSDGVSTYGDQGELF